MAGRDSGYESAGGAVAQVIREAGMAHVYVDCVLPGLGATTAVSVHPAGAGLCPPPSVALRLERLAPNPYRPGEGPLELGFALPAPGPLRVTLYDVAGRRVATLADGPAKAGEHVVRWDGRCSDGRAASPGLYLVRLEAAGAARSVRVVVVR